MPASSAIKDAVVVLPVPGVPVTRMFGRARSDGPGREAAAAPAPDGPGEPSADGEETVMWGAR